MGHAAHRRPCLIGLALLLAGCQAPPARPAACAPTAVPRKVIVARQFATDTAVMAAARPRRSAYLLVTGPAAYVRAWTAELVEKRVAPRLLGSPPPVCPDRPTLDPDELEAEAYRVSGERPTPADVRLQIDGDESLAALEQVIAGTTCRLDVIMYLWNSDDLGWRVARLLAARAGPGLPVRVIVDGSGNLIHGEPKDASATQVNAAVCWLARQPHVTLLRTHNPVGRLDHRKLVIADGRVAWNGGRNFGDKEFFQTHDLTYTVSGPPARTMAEFFDLYWVHQGGPPAPPLPSVPPPDEPNALARVLRTRPTERSLAQGLYAAVSRARHHVYVENPYFGDGHLLYLLARARQRGADVRAVLTLHSDSGLYDRANRVTANRLLAAGVRVYLYPTLMHAKASAVDGVWAYMGTGNFDNLSLRRNRELGIALSAGPAIAELEERLFLADFRPEWELTEPLPLSPLDYLYEFIAGAAA